MIAYIYLLKNSADKKYLGSTPDILKRLDEHNSGKTASTRGKGPWEIIGKWEFNSLVKARQMEYKIKNTKKKLSVENIESLINWFNKNE